MVQLSMGGVLAEDTNGVSVDDDADGATVDGRVSVEDTNGVSVDEGSDLLANDADGATVDGRISVDDADGALIDEGISVGEEHEVSVLMPIGGRVVNVVASTEVPVRAGTCWRAPLFVRVVIPRRVDSVGGEEHEVSVLLPIGGGVVDALALTGVPVGAGA